MLRYKNVREREVSTGDWRDKHVKVGNNKMSACRGKVFGAGAAIHTNNKSKAPGDG